MTFPAILAGTSIADGPLPPTVHKNWGFYFKNGTSSDSAPQDGNNVPVGYGFNSFYVYGHPNNGMASLMPDADLTAGLVLGNGGANEHYATPTDPRLRGVCWG